ncbi:hypothetical protein PFISCL1PPCAC_7070, partial [Pristionchus fissidentatus]
SIMAPLFLDFTKNDPLPSSDIVHRGEEGTIYHLKRESLNVSFVQVQRSSRPPFGMISQNCEFISIATFGRTTYVISDDRKIFKCTFSPPNCMQAELVRTVMECETIESGMLFSRKRDGKTVIYRACDDPVEEGLERDGWKEELQGCTLRALHRRKLIYVREGTRIAARQISPNSVVLTVSNMINTSNSVYCPNSDSPLLFFISGEGILSILNTESMKINSFPTKSNGNSLIIDGILSASEEKIIVRGRRDDSNELFVWTTDRNTTIESGVNDEVALRIDALTKENQELKEKLEIIIARMENL